MQKWLWIIGFLLVVSGLGLSIRFGLKPKPVALINPTQVDIYEEAGVIAYRRLRQNLKEERVWVLGSNPLISAYPQIWNGFIAAARNDDTPVDVLYTQRELKDLRDFTGVETKSISLDEDIDSLINEIKEHIYNKKRVLVQTVLNESSHMIEGAFIYKLESALERPVISFNLLPMAVNREEMDVLQPTCPEGLSVLEGLDPLGCAAANISRKFLRKRLSAKKLWVAMEKHGLKEVLLFIHQPQGLEK